MSRAQRILGPALLRSIRRQALSKFSGRRQQTRQFLSAVTLSPPLVPSRQFLEGDVATVLPGLIEATFAWASVGFERTDPPSQPSHALILVGRNLLPTDRETLLNSLATVEQLKTVNAVVGAVDRVGYDGRGVCVLLASKEEGITFETIKGSQPELLRVGRWHAKDEEPEEDEPFDFDNVMTSIKKGAEVTTVENNGESEGKAAIGKEFLLALGEAENLQKQAIQINQNYPTADIAGISLTKIPVSNSLATTLVHNGNLLPPTEIFLCRIPRAPDQEYLPAHFEHKLRWLTTSPKITSFAGNLIQGLDGHPAMPYLLSLLPEAKTEEERLEPPPLVARLHTRGQQITVNVLGGSTSRGAIALDPLVSTGRLSEGVKVDFAQLNVPRKQLVRLSKTSTGLLFETMKKAQVGDVKRMATWQRDQQKVWWNTLMAGSEEGFFVGKAGYVPWLCAVPGMGIYQQLTPYVETERRVPIDKYIAWRV